MLPLLMAEGNQIASESDKSLEHEVNSVKTD